MHDRLILKAIRQLNRDYIRANPRSISVLVALSESWLYCVLRRMREEGKVEYLGRQHGYRVR